MITISQPIETEQISNGESETKSEKPKFSLIKLLRSYYEKVYFYYQPFWLITTTAFEVFSILWRLLYWLNGNQSIVNTITGQEIGALPFFLIVPWLWWAFILLTFMIQFTAVLAIPENGMESKEPSKASAGDGIFWGAWLTRIFLLWVPIG